MIALVQKICLTIGPLLPAWFVKFVYLLPYRLLKNESKKDGVEVWYRHSVYFGDIVFGLSDLDLTIFYPGEMSHFLVVKMEKRIAFWRRLFPFIGEVSLYDGPFFQKVQPFFHPIELKRDPLLKKKFSHAPEIRKGDREVFILNWLASDAQKMRNHFSRREKKIKRFLSLLNIKYPEREIQSLSELIGFLCEKSFAYDTNWRNFLVEYCSFEFIEPASFNDFFQKFPQYKEFLLVAFPQKFIGAFHHHGEFEKAQNLISQLEPLKRAIFLAQYRWEIMGLMGQSQQRVDGVQMIIHLENLRSLLDGFPGQCQVESDGLQSLVNYHSQKWESPYAS